MNNDSVVNYNPELPILENVPVGMVILNVSMSAADPADADLSPAQARVLAELNLRDDSSYSTSKKKTFYVKGRFRKSLIECYYPMNAVTVLHYNGEVFNIANSPNEIDSLISGHRATVKYEDKINQG